MFDSQNFKDKMQALGRRHEEVGALLGTAEVINKRAEFLKLSREHAELDPLVTAWRAYSKLVNDLAAAKQMAEAEKDPELREMAREEMAQLEAARLAADLYRMYLRYAERQGWKVETMSLNEGTAGGFKEAVVLIDGKDVF